MGSGKGRHRRPGSYISFSPFLQNKKCPCSPMGNKDRNYYFCGTTLFAGNPATSGKRQHALCPITLALRQKILSFHRSLCPPRPIFCPAFRSALSYAKLSVDALAALLPLLRFVLINMLRLLNTICVRLSRTFFRKGRTFFYSRKLCTLNTPGSRPGQRRSIPRYCRRWARNSRSPASARFLRSSGAAA